VANRVTEQTPTANPERRGPHSLIALARRFLAESLFKNSAFLVVNLGVGALCGYGSLALLTHVFSVQDVGISATAVSAMSLITTITQFGITYSLPRYLPTAKNRAAMINTLTTAVMLATLLCAAAFLALPYAGKFLVLGGWLFGIAFVVITCFQAGSVVLSTVLVADRSSDKVATFGTVANLVRLASPPAFSLIGSLGSFVARVAADVVSFVLYAGVLVRRGHRFRPAFSIDVTREIGRFSAGMYLANLVGGLPQLLLPLIALSRVGAQQAAYWSIATSISAMLFSLPSTVAQALLPEVSFRPAERRALLRRAALLTVAIVTPALLVAFAAVPLVLATFGHGYTAGTLGAVRWLIGAGFITILNAMTGAILFIAKKSTMITIVNAVNAVVVIGIVAAWATSATDIGIAWAVGDVVNTVLFGAFAVLALREVGWRWDKLGEGRVAGAAAASEQAPGTEELVTTVTGQQAAVDMYRPRPASLTTSMELFSIAALQAAEEQRGLYTVNPTVPVPRLRDTLTFDRLVDRQRRGLDALISLADQQRQAARRDADEQDQPDGGSRPAWGDVASAWDGEPPAEDGGPRAEDGESPRPEEPEEGE
jgi:O-antigen/teichoic acid export membrane protein